MRKGMQMHRIVRCVLNQLSLKRNYFYVGVAAEQSITWNVLSLKIRQFLSSFSRKPLFKKTMFVESAIIHRQVGKNLVGNL